MRAIVYSRLAMLTVLVLLCAPGCHSAWFARQESLPPLSQTPTTTTTTQGAPPTPSLEPNDSSLQTANGPTTEQEALAEVADQLHAIEAIDPKAKQKLMADLEEAEPEHWPLMVQQFRSALDYRNQLVARDIPSKVGPSAPQLALSPFPTNQTREQLAASNETSTLAMQISYPNTGAKAVTPVSAMVASTVKKSHTVKEVTKKNTSTVLPPPKESEPLTYQEPEQPPPLRENPLSWQIELDQAVTAFEQSASNSPGSTQEVHQNMRLRLLYLLAGREDDALAPVPGATPAQQDYWSNQMFAVSTFLDSENQPNNKQRDAAALIHLDKARSKLAEMGPLQVRNLAFVQSVDGYGTYHPDTSQSFRPGQQVTLYAEVEHFRSESTPEGQRSSLGTSYQVLDQQGHRVDTGQFPEVEDFCKNVRRDFHVQYGIALPTRIYPGNYELRLTVTDNLSNKLGHATVPFEISETAQP